MIHTPLQETERKKLSAALKRNHERGTTLLAGNDTTFIGTADSLEEIQAREDNEVVFAIKSIPCHY